MSEGFEVELSVRVGATPATVWRCVTESGLLSEWLGAHVVMDPRPGGAVSIHFARYGTRVAGEVAEVVPERRIAFTWGVTEGPDAADLPPGSTRVAIDLAPEPDGATRVTLRHSGFPTELQRDHHVQGWTAYLGGLAQTAVANQAVGGLEGVVDDYLAAWGLADAAERIALLERCFEAEGTFRDRYSEGTGREWLARHIEVARAMFPGVRIERTGPVLQSRDALMCPWRAVLADGQPFAQGFDAFRLGPAGRLAHVEGFWQT